MTGGTRQASTFPRRDARGRVVSLTEMMAAVAAGWLLGLAALAAVDGLVTLLGLGPFGRVSGWLAAVLPVWLFVEDARGWRPVTGRYPLALGCALVGLAAGVASAQIVDGWLPPLGSGAVAAAVACGCYPVLWFHGIRWLGGREESR